MLVKIAALFKNEKLINYVMVFGLTALGMMFVTIIAWSERLGERFKKRRRAFADTRAAEKDLDE